MFSNLFAFRSCRTTGSTGLQNAQAYGLVSFIVNKWQQFSGNTLTELQFDQCHKLRAVVGLLLRVSEKIT